MESAPSDRETIQRLIEKYDRPGPRYTSYPTAVEFTETVGASAYEERLREADALGDAPLSLYTHIPFCEERCLFCGCHVIITRKHERTLPYLDFLRREIEMVAERLPRRRRFAQLHLGGGTPTYYRPDELRSLVEALLARFEPLPGAEMAVEVDPRVTTEEHIDVLADCGFNRVSMGVQDFTPEVQERIHRVQTTGETKAIVDRARLRGYSGINVDLIYGLPLQTPETFEQTVDRVIELGVDRVACYSFAFVPWIRGHQTRLDESELPSRNVKMELFAIVREKLLASGYEAIGMDHFARPGDELARAKRERRLRRNFQGYAVVPGDDVLGFGVSAIGDVRGSLIQNEKKLSGYQRAIDAGRLPVFRGFARSRDDLVRADVIHRLMCNFVIDVEDVERRWNLPFGDSFREDLALLAPHADEGLVEIGAKLIRATPIGELFVRNLAMCFDRYMREKHAREARPVFSRTV
jgi:oxygen-independent coproporphyrinogen-3 oxidase